MEPVRIIVVDALELVADGLRFRLSAQPRLQLVGYAGSGQALFELLPTTPSDLVLIDVSVPLMDGIDTTRRLRKEHPQVKVLAHSALTEIEYVNSMLIEGAAGYLLKNASAADLVEAINTVMDGGRYISVGVQANLDRGYQFTEKRMDGEYIGLTEREREIIRLVALEKTNEEIADALHVSVETVKTHRKNLMTKLNVRSIAGLVKYAVDRCWV